MWRMMWNRSRSWRLRPRSFRKHIRYVHLYLLVQRWKLVEPARKLMVLMGNFLETVLKSLVLKIREALGQ